MDKNSVTRFNKAPMLTKGRTRFDLSHTLLTTFNTGDLVPILVEPVYPGETHQLNTSSLIRLETSLHQTMDNAYLETAFFFVPLKLVYSYFDKFLGANDDPWTQTLNFELPQLHLSSSSTYVNVKPQSLLNYIGIPAGNYGYGRNSSTKYLDIDETPLRAVFQIYNDWYRDENYDSIVSFPKDQTSHNADVTWIFNGGAFKANQETLKVNRFKDVFSTALPAPQKGQEVSFSILGTAPVLPSAHTHYSTSDALKVFTSAGGLAQQGNLGVNASGQVYDGSNTPPSGTTQLIYGTNLEADLSTATAVTINSLRLAICRQAMKERDARGGTRLNEKIYSVWGIQTNPLEIDRSEFLGGKRIPINMMEVLQTSETGTTVLGTDAGHSKTLDSGDSFIRSFTQYGWIIGFVYVRTDRTYSQGIDRKLRNKVLLDLVDPMLDNVGEVDIKKSEIYALDTSTGSAVDVANGAWAYQEQYYWVKERSSRANGYFQPGINGTLDSWHYGDNYASMPQISASWLKETPNQVDRTIAVTSSTPLAFQWKANFAFDYKVTRTLAKYSIPNTFGF